MVDYLKKILAVAGEKKREIPFMLFLYVVALVLELAGISMIIPFVAVIQDPERLEQHDIWQQISALFGLKSATDDLLFLSGVVFLIYLTKTILNIQIQRMIIRFSFDVQVYLREKFSSFYLGAPYLFHTRRRSNEIINLLQSHISQYSKAVLGSLLRLTGEGLTLMAILLFLLVSYPIPTITAFALLSIFGLLYDRVVRQKLQQSGAEVIAANKDLLRTVRQGITSIKEASVLGVRHFFLQEITDSAERASNVNAYVNVLQMLPRYILEFLLVVVVISSCVLMITIEQTQERVIDSLAVFAVAAIRLLPMANQIISNVGNLRFSRRALEELYGDLLLLSDQSLLDKPEARKVTNDYNSFAIENISFTYPGTDNPVLKNADLAFEKGEIIGICGPSGSGKSTLVDILLGLIVPDEGRFRLDGLVISSAEWGNYDLASYIPQKPVMLDDTILNNVALGQEAEQIDKDRVIKSLENAQLMDFVSTLPRGIETSIGEDAILFSGGQRQRIAIARSFYFNRPIIIFDEATSALDKDVEREVMQAIGHLKKEATVVIISHNEQPLQICDRICYLSDGFLTEKPKEKIKAHV